MLAFGVRVGLLVVVAVDRTGRIPLCSNLE
jgi:hypothetical protein